MSCRKERKEKELEREREKARELEKPKEPEAPKEPEKPSSEMEISHIQEKEQISDQEPAKEANLVEMKAEDPSPAVLSIEPPQDMNTDSNISAASNTAESPEIPNVPLALQFIHIAHEHLGRYGVFLLYFMNTNQP